MLNPLTKAAKLRLAGLSTQAKLLAARVETQELSAVALIRMVILALEDCRSGRDDLSLVVANDVFVYLGRRKNSPERKWLMCLFERHGGLLYVSGRFCRYNPWKDGRVIPHTFDRAKLDSELQALNAPEHIKQHGPGKTIFDSSICRQTMRASKFAK